MNAYRWRTGSHMRGDAQAAGEVCQELEERGELTQAKLVDVSRPEDARLHNMFEWNDTVAAEKFREVQAGKIIRSLEISIESAEPQVTRAYVSISVDDSPREYVGIVRAMNDEDKRKAVLDSARRELRWFKEKYKGLYELSKVFEAIEEVV